MILLPYNSMIFAEYDLVQNLGKKSSVVGYNGEIAVICCRDVPLMNYYYYCINSQLNLYHIDYDYGLIDYHRYRTFEEAYNVLKESFVVKKS